MRQILEELADDPISRARFLLEAEITGGLEHAGAWDTGDVAGAAADRRRAAAMYASHPAEARKAT
jgi:hypothetical protein